MKKGRIFALAFKETNDVSQNREQEKFETVEIMR